MWYGSVRTRVYMKTGHPHKPKSPIFPRPVTNPTPHWKRLLPHFEKVLRKLLRVKRPRPDKVLTLHISPEVSAWMRRVAAIPDWWNTRACGPTIRNVFFMEGLSDRAPIIWVNSWHWFMPWPYWIKRRNIAFRFTVIQ